MQEENLKIFQTKPEDEETVRSEELELKTVDKIPMGQKVGGKAAEAEKFPMTDYF